MYFTKLQRKKRKRRIEREKDEEAGGGDMAWNSKKQCSRTLLQFKPHTQVEIKFTCYKQLREYLILYFTPLSVLQWRQKVQIKQPLQPYCR